MSKTCCYHYVNPLRARDRDSHAYCLGTSGFPRFPNSGLPSSVQFVLIYATCLYFQSFECTLIFLAVQPFITNPISIHGNQLDINAL
jgi:hypothetical protein